MSRQGSIWNEFESMLRANERLARERAKERIRNLKKSMIDQVDDYNARLEKVNYEFITVDEDKCYVTNEEKNRILNYYNNQKKK